MDAPAPVDFDAGAADGVVEVGGGGVCRRGRGGAP